MNVEANVHVEMEGIENKDDSIVIVGGRVDSTIQQNDSHSLCNSVNIEPNEINNISDGNVISQKANRRIVEGLNQEQNPRVTDPVKNVHEHLSPIVEYMQEPLLTLVQACIPLLDIVPNLSTYIEQVLRETPHQPPDDLTFDESAAVRLYTMEWVEVSPSLYIQLNATLKNADRQSLRPYLKYLKLLLTALIKLPCAPLQTVWRGVNIDLSVSFPRGTPVTWWAFSSCTTSLTVLENNIYLSKTGDRTLFSVEAINGRMIRAHSHFDFEDEIILLPGTYMEVQSQLSPAPGLHIIHLKQIKPSETLLELPFHGACLYPVDVKVKPWYKKKRTMFEVAVLIALCLAGIIVGLVVGTRGSPLPSLCTPRSLGIHVDLLWSFDCANPREDLKRIDNGTAMNGASYSAPDFSGRGQALRLNRKLNQCVQLPQSLKLTSNTSFTVSFWMFSTDYNQATILKDCYMWNSVCTELYIFSVQVCAKTYNWNNDKEMHLVVFNAWRVNYQSCWIHLAFVFDHQIKTLFVYFNGEMMRKNSFSPSSFASTKANHNLPSYFGTNSLSKNAHPFDGLIDQFTVSYYRKNSSDIQDEATLLCSYNFDTEDIDHDSGPNNIQAYSENVYRLITREQHVLLFNSSDSFFQTLGFTLLMSNFYSFTIAFWLRPVLHPSDRRNSAVAVLQLASKVQQISSEIYVCFLNLYIVNITGASPAFRFTFGQLNEYWPVEGIHLQNSTWTHFAVTYSNQGTLTVHINGVLYQKSIRDTRFSLLLYAPRLALTIGGDYFDDIPSNKPTNHETRKCFAERPEYNYTQFYGEIDQLRFYARSLTPAEYLALATTKNVTLEESTDKK